MHFALNSQQDNHAREMSFGLIDFYYLLKMQDYILFHDRN
jgi:hypothetical protein